MTGSNGLMSSDRPRPRWVDPVSSYEAVWRRLPVLVVTGAVFLTAGLALVAVGPSSLHRLGALLCAPGAMLAVFLPVVRGLRWTQGNSGYWTKPPLET